MGRLSHVGWFFCIAAFTAFFIVLGLPSTSHALIRGDKGNKPIDDPGWPKGAAAVFNTTNRIAWWEGPPLGGGQWHSECQGTTDALNQTLQDFGAIDSTKKRIVIRDGVGSSFWLDPNRQSEGASAIELDWVFVVWQSDRLEMQRKLPAEISSLRRTRETVAEVELTIFTGGAIQWSDVKLTEDKKIEIIDQRLKSHGYSPQDKHVIEGVLRTTDGKGTIQGVVRLERVSPNPKGGYTYETVLRQETGADGKWVLKEVPEEWLRLIAEADGYLPRVLKYFQFSKQPSWERVDATIAKQSLITGRVIDTNGKPLDQATVRMRGLEVSDGIYETASEREISTDSNGRFSLPAVETGAGKLSAYRTGYVYRGLGLQVSAPSSDVELRMEQSATIVVRVNFPISRPKGDYMIHIEPKEGSKVGSWGGGGNINDENELIFENVPPGEYAIYGRPNPGSDKEQTKTIIQKAEPGKESVVELDAK